MNELRALNRVGLASLAFGGFLLLSYLAFVYSAIWRDELLIPLPGQEQRLFPANETNESPHVGTNLSGLSENETINHRRPFAPPTPLTTVLSPYAVLWFLVGAAFIANGYFLLRYTRSQEVKQTKEFVISTVLTEEEKTFYNALKDKDGAMTQKELSRSLGFSAVKTHRIVSRLAEKKLVKTYPFGMTNKVVLEKN